jgi:hypothetical protein
MLKISRDRTYRHRNSTEADMRVIRIIALYPDGFRLDVAWINRHMPHVCIPDRVFLKRADLPNWEELPEPEKSLPSTG